MRSHNRFFSQIFLEGDAGGGSGSGDQVPPIETPFDKIDLEELDDTAAEQIRTAKAEFIRVQTEAQTAKQQLEREQQIARQWQSKADKFDALQKQQQMTPVEDPYKVKATEMLKGRGVSPDKIAETVDFYADIIRAGADMAKMEVGRDMSPLVGTVVSREAESSFLSAQSDPKVGPLLQHPEVAQAVWEGVQAMVQQGQVMDPTSVANFTKMVAFDKGVGIGHNGGTVNQQTPAPVAAPSFPRVGGGSFTFPGASRPVMMAPTAGPALDADTDAALHTVFKMLSGNTGVMPKAYQNRSTGGRR